MSILQQAQRQLATISPLRFRQAPHQPHVAFEVLFADEHVVGSAGPYRAFFADVCAEAVGSTNAANSTSSKATSANRSPLPLFTLCPNGVMSHGENRDKYILRPLGEDATDSLQVLEVTIR